MHLYVYGCVQGLVCLEGTVTHQPQSSCFSASFLCLSMPCTQAREIRYSAVTEKTLQYAWWHLGNQNCLHQIAGDIFITSTASGLWLGNDSQKKKKVIESYRYVTYMALLKVLCSVCLSTHMAAEKEMSWFRTWFEEVARYLY